MATPAFHTAGPQVAVIRAAKVPWPNGILAVSPVVTLDVPHVDADRVGRHRRVHRLVSLALRGRCERHQERAAVCQTDRGSFVRAEAAAPDMSSDADAQVAPLGREPLLFGAGLGVAEPLHRPGKQGSDPDPQVAVPHGVA